MCWIASRSRGLSLGRALTVGERMVRGGQIDVKGKACPDWNGMGGKD